MITQHYALLGQTLGALTWRTFAVCTELDSAGHNLLHSMALFVSSCILHLWLYTQYVAIHVVQKEPLRLHM